MSCSYLRGRKYGLQTKEHRHEIRISQQDSRESMLQRKVEVNIHQNANLK